MIVLGLVLIGFAVLLAAGVAASSGNRATLDVFGIGFDTRSSVVFFFGVAIGIALIAGLWLTKLGLARGFRRRKEVRQLRQQAQAAPAPLADMSASHETPGNEVAAGNETEPVGRHASADPDPAPRGTPDGDDQAGQADQAGKTDRVEADRATESPVTAPRDLPRRHTEVRE